MYSLLFALLANILILNDQLTNSDKSSGTYMPSDILTLQLFVALLGPVVEV